MSDNVKISVIGGDMRQIAAARLFAEGGAEVAVFGFDLFDGDLSFATKCPSVGDAVRGAGAVILPLPYTTDGNTINAPLHDGKALFSDLLEKLTDTQVLCGGMLGIDRPFTYDYYEREELKILNAIPTAEGAIGIALAEMPITLHGAKAVVIGFGRVGSALAERLKALGCHVTVAARRESDLARCESSSYGAVHIRKLGEVLHGANVVFNTVPAKILNSPMLDYIDRSTLIIDLAGRPGGVDFDAAKQMGLRVVWALSLPGRTAPVTAGKIIFKTLENILRQEGVL